MLQNKKKNIAAIIPAAGRSKRMGSPKALLLCENGMSFAEKTAGQFHKFGISEIVFVINSDFEQEFKNSAGKFSFIKTVVNPAPEKGRFFSFLCGLQQLPPNIEYCFLHNVDNPLHSLEIPTLLYENRNNADYLIPSFEGKGGHPILLNKKVLKAALSEKNHKRILKDFLNQYQKRYIPTSSPTILRNINTPDDYKKYRQK